MYENVCIFEGEEIGTWRHHGKGVWFTARARDPLWARFEGPHDSIIDLYGKLRQVPESVLNRRHDAFHWLFAPVPGSSGPRGAGRA